MKDTINVKLRHKGVIVLGEDNSRWKTMYKKAELITVGELSKKNHTFHLIPCLHDSSNRAIATCQQDMHALSSSESPMIVKST